MHCARCASMHVHAHGAAGNIRVSSARTAPAPAEDPSQLRNAGRVVLSSLAVLPLVPAAARANPSLIPQPLRRLQICTQSGCKFSCERARTDPKQTQGSPPAPCAVGAERCGVGLPSRRIWSAQARCAAEFDRDAPGGGCGPVGRAAGLLIAARRGPVLRQCRWVVYPSDAMHCR